MKKTATSDLSRVGIKTRLAKQLANPAFRRRFFRARGQEEVAQQILELRERRGFRQIDLARAARMKQSAVSRIEKAGYSAWTYRTLLRIAEALDAQLRIVVEPQEDVVARYQREAREELVLATSSLTAATGSSKPTNGRPLIHGNGAKRRSIATATDGALIARGRKSRNHGTRTPR
jgi:transcriptional regulator with XRE-family HTH domain